MTPPPPTPLNRQRHHITFERSELSNTLTQYIARVIGIFWTQLGIFIHPLDRGS